MFRLIVGEKVVPTSAVALGTGLYLSENASGVPVLTTDPTDFGAQTPGAVLARASDEVPLFGEPGGTLVVGPVPAAATELDAHFRGWKQLVPETQVRLSVSVVTAAPLGTTMTIEQSTDQGATWAALAAAATPLAVALDAAGVVKTGWCDVAAGAVTDALLRVVLAGGDDAGSVELGPVWLEFSGTLAEGVVPCVEVARDRFGAYADDAALTAVWTEVANTFPGGSTTVELDDAHVLGDTMALHVQVDADAGVTVGQVFAVGRTWTGLLPNTIYTLKYQVWREGEWVAGFPTGAWDEIAEVVTSNGSGEVTHGIFLEALEAPGGDLHFELWAANARVEVCP